MSSKMPGACVCGYWLEEVVVRGERERERAGGRRGMVTYGGL